jgi:chromosome partitioning protein
MIKTMDLMQGEQQERFQYTILPTMFDKRTKASILAYQQLQDTYKDKVWSGVIPIDTNFRNASLARKVPSHFSANSRGVFAYKNLLRYLMKLA